MPTLGLLVLCCWVITIMFWGYYYYVLGYYVGLLLVYVGLLLVYFGLLLVSVGLLLVYVRKYNKFLLHSCLQIPLSSHKYSHKYYTRATHNRYPRTPCGGIIFSSSAGTRAFAFFNTYSVVILREFVKLDL